MIRMAMQKRENSILVRMASPTDVTQQQIPVSWGFQQVVRTEKCVTTKRQQEDNSLYLHFCKVIINQVSDFSMA